MEKIITIVVALVAVFAVNAADLTTAVKTKITNAVKNGDFVAAAQWSATLNNIKQAEFAEKQTQLVKKVDGIATVYDNVIKTAPVVLKAASFYVQKTDNSKDSEMMCKGLDLIAKLIQRPLTDADIAPVNKSLIERELKDQEASRAHYEQIRKNYHQQNRR